jgi:hypothetical protein
MVFTQKKRFALAASILLSQSHTLAFVPAGVTSYNNKLESSTGNTYLQVTDPSQTDESAIPIQKKIAKSLKPIAFSVLSVASTALLPDKAFASAPVTPIRNFKPPDSKAIALKKISEERNKLKMKEEMAHQIKCDDIEREQGIEARQAYEKAYQDEKIQEAEIRAVERKKLLYGLVDMGICPFVDVEGERQMYLFDYGIDLNKVPSSAQQKEMMTLKRDKQHSIRREKERFIVKCIVEDVKLRGEDPLKYLEANKAQTNEILNLKDKQLDAVVARYKQLLQTQGSLSGVRADKPFDMEAAVAVPMTAEEAAKNVKAEKAALKAKAKADKAAKKAEAKAKKEAAKIAAAKAAKDNADEQTSSPDDVLEDDVESEPEEVNVPVKQDTKTIQNIISKVPVVPIISVVGVSGAGIAFNNVQKNKAAEEKEREKQFKLLMGMESGLDDDNEEEDDGKDDEPYVGEVTKIEEKSPTPIELPKKKRKGFSVFSKKNARESDLAVLVAPDAVNTEFSSLLAKLLTFGAPGRFPAVVQLPGGMPMDTFDLEKAKELLSESRSRSEMSDEEAAEAFACVVNCMIIDIIDLASSSLSIKDKKNTDIISALNIVMDFMDHAASLFDAVAENVSITPVTYGGNLSKGKLEEMFTIYATSMMTSMDGSVTQDRIDTLQQVFNINDKKAEGLVQKGMMKNLVKMMKDGPEGMEGMEGMEGLSEMMASMAGAGGGMPGFEDGDISPEQLKQSVEMMKELIGSGSISKEELDLVREQFKQMYGSDISELIKAADEEGGAEELGKDGQELLELFKTILKED